MLDVYDRIGSLDTGKDADVVILDKEYSVVDTFVKGSKNRIIRRKDYAINTIKTITGNCR